MKKITLLIAVLFAISFLTAHSQTSSDILKVHDTRYINDAPNSNTHAIRADFKLRKTIGVPGNGNFSTSLTISPWADNSGDYNHQLNFNNGGIYYRIGTHSSQTWNRWQKMLTEDSNANVGIGTENPTSKLDVSGTIRAKEVKIEAAGWADFVFNEDYNLRPLSEVETHIREHKHLPEVPSEKEVLENGISLGDMQARLLQKIEELTLYVIEQDKKIGMQDKRIRTLEEENRKLKND